MKTLSAHDSSLSTLTEKNILNDSIEETRFGEHLLYLLIKKSFYAVDGEELV